MTSSIYSITCLSFTGATGLTLGLSLSYFTLAAALPSAAYFACLSPGFSYKGTGAVIEPFFFIEGS